MSDKWSKISENLQKKLDAGTFKVWIAPLNVKVEAAALHVTAPNTYIRDWLEARLTGAMREAASPVLGIPPEAVQVHFSVVAPLAVKIPATVTRSGIQSTPSRQVELPLRMPVQPLRPVRDDRAWRYSFEDFVVGSSNNVAVAAAQDVCHSGGCVQTLFVNSSSGLGKTHLTQAVGRQASSRQDERVAYLTAEDFASRFVAAQRNREVEDFKARLQGLDLLLLEDVHFFQGKEGMQNMALTIIKSLLARGGRLVCTSSFAPRELQQMDDQLISYFCSGILTKMERPNEDMRRNILTRKAKSHQVLLPDAVCELLAARLNSDIRQMESCLNSMIFKARLLNSPLTTDLALEVLEQYAAVVYSGLDMSGIIRMICESFGVNERQLTSRSRKRECVDARNTAFFLARKHTELSLAEIGSHFNRRHSTVINGITSIEKEMARQSTQGRRFSRVVDLIERNAGVST